MQREPNRMVPTRLLRRLREAQEKGDPEKVRKAVHEIDKVTGLRCSGCGALWNPPQGVYFLRCPLCGRNN